MNKIAYIVLLLPITLFAEQSTKGGKSPIVNTTGDVSVTYNQGPVSDRERLQQNPIEFTDLLKEFSADENSTGSIAALKWSVGSSRGSKIKWSHSGTKFTSDLTEKQKIAISKIYGPIFREGLTTITNNKKPSHTILRETLELVEWSIRIFGVRGGADYVTLENMESVQAFEDYDGDLEIPKKYLKDEVNLCTSDKYASDVYSSNLKVVKLPNRRLFNVVENSYCGGQDSCFYDYTMFIQKPTIEELRYAASSCLSDKAYKDSE